MTDNKEIDLTANLVAGTAWLFARPELDGRLDYLFMDEAEVVLVSMATSSAVNLPREIGFLYSKNRLNVAISRARSLAIVVANPRLLEIPCRTVEQVQLVNTLCWAADIGRVS